MTVAETRFFRRRNRASRRKEGEKREITSGNAYPSGLRPVHEELRALRRLFQPQRGAEDEFQPEMVRTGNGDEACVGTGFGEDPAVGERDDAVRRSVINENRTLHIPDPGQIRERIVREQTNARHDADRALEGSEEHEPADGVFLGQITGRPRPDGIADDKNVRRGDPPPFRQKGIGRIGGLVHAAFRRFPGGCAVSGIIVDEDRISHLVEMSDPGFAMGHVFGVSVGIQNGLAGPGNGRPNAGNSPAQRLAAGGKTIRMRGRMEHGLVHDHAAGQARQDVQPRRAQQETAEEAAEFHGRARKCR